MKIRTLVNSVILSGVIVALMAIACTLATAQVIIYRPAVTMAPVIQYRTPAVSYVQPAVRYVQPVPMIHAAPLYGRPLPVYGAVRYPTPIRSFFGGVPYGGGYSGIGCFGGS